MILELDGLEIPGRHGVEGEERREDRPFLYDIQLEVGEAGLTDRIEEAVDYREVATCVRDVSDARQFHLLEALAAAVADALVERFPVEHARVRVRKPNPPGLRAAFSAATVERSSSG